MEGGGLQEDKQGGEDVVQGHEDRCCPVVGEILRQEYDYEAIHKGSQRGANEHGHCKLSHLPGISVPIAEPQK